MLDDANADGLELEIDELEEDDNVADDADPSVECDSDDELEGEVAADVARSDAADINLAAEEADLDGRLDPLPRAVRAASALSITKVCQVQSLSLPCDNCL